MEDIFKILGDIIKPESKRVRCISCGGDGKETCNNPDHGFLDMLSSFRGANESACPVCGHDEYRKVNRGKNICPECNGIGILTEDMAIKLADEIGYDNEFEYIN